jgi:hypothetical protein
MSENLTQPIFKGQLRGLDRCGANEIAVGTDSGVFVLEKRDASWVKKLVTSLQGAGVACSQDGHFLAVSAERTRYIYWRETANWQLIDTAPIADQQDVLFGGPNFLLVLPAQIPSSRPQAVGRLFTASNARPHIGEVKLDFGDLFSFARDAGAKSTILRLDNPIEGGPSSDILVRSLLFESAQALTVVFDLGNVKVSYVAWTKGAADHWAVGKLPVGFPEGPWRSDKGDSLVVPIHTQDASSASSPDVEIMDCPLSLPFNCSERSRGSESAASFVTYGKGAILERDGASGCFEVREIVDSRVATRCLTLSPEYSHTTALSVLPMSSTWVISFAQLDGESAQEDEPGQGMSTYLFELPPKP